MPVMSDAEARVASAQEKLDAAEAEREAVRGRLEAAQADYLAAAEVWSRASEGDPEAERAVRARAAREAARAALDQVAKEIDRVDLAYYRALVARDGGRIDFPDSEEWAELETRPDHAQYIALRKAAGHIAAAGSADIDGLMDGMGKIVSVLLRSWHVLDRNGAELPLTADGLRRCPWDRMKPIYERAMAIHRAIPDPNR